MTDKDKAAREWDEDIRGILESLANKAYTAGRESLRRELLEWIDSRRSFRCDCGLDELRKKLGGE